MSTHNICFHGHIRKISTFFAEKKKCLVQSSEHTALYISIFDPCHTE